MRAIYDHRDRNWSQVQQKTYFSSGTAALKIYKKKINGKIYIIFWFKLSNFVFMYIPNVPFDREVNGQEWNILYVVSSRLFTHFVKSCHWYRVSGSPVLYSSAPWASRWPAAAARSGRREQLKPPSCTAPVATPGTAPRRAVSLSQRARSRSNSHATGTGSPRNWWAPTLVHMACPFYTNIADRHTMADTDTKRVMWLLRVCI